MPIEGEVRGDNSGNLEAVLMLRIQDFSRFEITGEFIIDTGFSGGISLTSDQIAQLNLASGPDIATVLADGTLASVATYTAVVIWDSGVHRIVHVIRQDAAPLAGMALLSGHNLSVDITEGGVARIVALSP